MKSKKKVLIVCSVISFIEWFNKENIEYLNKVCNLEVHLACNFQYFEDTDKEKTMKYIEKIERDGVILHQIEFARSPFSINNYFAYKTLKKLIHNHEFSLIHVHTPTVSIITRLAARKARKRGSVVMYTCHGFHFHNAAPKLNWCIYYPIEKFMSRYCDYLVTINKEDYNRAKKFSSPEVRYIPGVGVNLSRIQNCNIDKREYKKKLGIPEDSMLILSIGELIPRKNHKVIIEALANLKDSRLFYAICGKGPLLKELQTLAQKKQISNNVKFLGFRNDIPELCNVADISAFPSLIEGLGLAGIEAMAAGVPLVSSNVHGILDYVVDGETGFACNPHDINGFAEAINKLVDDENLRYRMGQQAQAKVQKFDISNALKEMWKIYDEILK